MGIPQGGEVASKRAPAPTTGASGERPEAVSGRTSVPMIMQEKGASVGHKGRVFVPPPPVLLVFPPSKFLLRQPWLLLRRGARAHNDWGRVLGRRRGLDIIKVHHISLVFLVGKRQLVEHRFGVGYGGLGWLRDRARDGLGTGRAEEARLRGAVAEGFPGTGRRRRRIVDVARIAVIGGIVFVAADGAVCHRVIVQVGQNLGATVLLRLVLDAAATDDLPASCARCGHCVSERARLGDESAGRQRGCS